MAQLDLIGILCVGLLLFACASASIRSLEDNFEQQNKTDLELGYHNPIVICNTRDSSDCPAHSRIAYKFNHNLYCHEGYCMCDECPKKPRCKPGLVLHELSTGNGQPGSCCSTYECGPIPDCVEGSPIIFWRDSCIRCSSCHEMCTSECQQYEPPAENCLSSDGQYKSINESWIQGNGCETCTCIAGMETSCVSVLCKTPECANPKKEPNECCPVCAEPDIVTIESTPPVQISSTAWSSPSTESSTRAWSSPSTESSSTAWSSPSTESSTSSSSTAETKFEEDSQELNSEEEYESTTEQPTDEETKAMGMETTIPAYIYRAKGSSTVNSMEEVEESSRSSSTANSMEYTTLSATSATSATSAPAAQTPESTSWHRESAIDDDEYHYPQNSDDAVRPSNKLNDLIIGVTVVIAVIIVAVAMAWTLKAHYKHCKKYDMVPCLEANKPQVPNIRGSVDQPLMDKRQNETVK
ncbi:suppressor protein SRP40 [Drosophila navojoa]|uniref:suppressor protein SRP40 n=1 Tax=Drosophila navojoa TaxID=7232 RepID=UPI000847D077|nr:suppressor protein SRP40 [Drosophila navojoa]